MKDLIAACLLVPMLGGTAEVAANTCSDINRAFAVHAAAVQARDIKALEATLTLGPELVLILPNGTMTRTRAEFLEFHRQFFAAPGWAIAFDVVSKVEGDDYAIITTKSRYRDVADGKPFESSNWVTFGFRREDGCWKLVHDQNTRRPAE
jgi:ketosteroid isomerase-like protein